MTISDSQINMSYEYSLRRLFRPPVDHLPCSEQLKYYKQRDLTSSHVYRLGTSLFKQSGSVVRRRVIDAVSSTPRVIPPGRLSGRVARNQVKDHASNSSDGESQHEEYQQWLAHRQSMRNGLDMLGANKQWLLSKNCTPLEKRVFSQLTHDRVQEQPIQLPDVQAYIVKVPSQRAPKEQPVSHKKNRTKQILEEITSLESHLAKHRARLVNLLSSADRKCNCFISVSDLLCVLNKLKAPISQATVEVLLEVLDIVDSKLDYRQLLSGELIRAAKGLVQERSLALQPGQVSDLSPSVNSTTSEDIVEVVKNLQPSTLSGDNGKLVDAYRQEEVRQFAALIYYCKENGVILDRALAEKALLLPSEHSLKECKANLRQPGLLPSSDDFKEPQEEEYEQEEKEKLIYEGFGRHYRLCGPKKAKYTRMSTGGAKIKAKVDCWITFSEYQRLTEHIRSRPGFKYKDHGLPDNTAFWPGALLDKLRLWMPKLSKVYSVHNMFQPVQHPLICNPYSPVVEQRVSWPDNKSGYVQFGSQNRKQYHL